MYLSIRTLNIACLTGFLALAIGGGFGVARCAKAKADRIERDKKAVEVLRVGLNKAQDALVRLDSTLGANQTALDMLRERLLTSEPIGGFLAGLDAVASKADVKVKQVAPGQSVREEICTRTPLAFACEGSFAGLHAVLYGLERADRLVRVEQFSISRSSPSNRCSMNVTCSVYGR